MASGEKSLMVPAEFWDSTVVVVWAMEGEASTSTAVSARVEVRIVFFISVRAPRGCFLAHGRFAARDRSGRVIDPASLMKRYGEPMESKANQGWGNS
jgi:hypothetical protein